MKRVSLTVAILSLLLTCNVADSHAPTETDHYWTQKTIFEDAARRADFAVARGRVPSDVRKIFLSSAEMAWDSYSRLCLGLRGRYDECVFLRTMLTKPTSEGRADLITVLKSKQHAYHQAVSQVQSRRRSMIDVFGEYAVQKCESESEGDNSFGDVLQSKL
jgi:hypothetical protein